MHTLKVHENYETTAATRQLIALLSRWPRNRIAQYLLPHPDPHRLLLSGELELQLQASARRHLTLRHSEKSPPSPALGILDEGFPDLLRHIPDPPLVLYFRGHIELLAQPAVAIVGARRCSVQGREMAWAIARDLACRDITVVSGLALGIDGAAHRGALDARTDGGSTVAVLGGGLHQVYPRTHRSLARDILERGGVLLSEYPDGMPPLAHQFPERNRLISGLSAATVVVEATLNSGSLITARYAAEQGRDVFAVPGPATHAISQGCHRLIQEGAGLVTSGEDVLLALGCEGAEKSGGPVPPQTQGIAQNLPADARRVLDCVHGYTRSIDELCVETGFDVEHLIGLLVEMEILGIVQQSPLGYSRRS